MSAIPLAQAACRGVQESSSCWFISEPWVIRILTTAKLLSRMAWCKAVMPEIYDKMDRHSWDACLLACLLASPYFKIRPELRPLEGVTGYNANVSRGLPGVCRFSLQYLWHRHRGRNTRDENWLLCKGPTLFRLICVLSELQFCERYKGSCQKND